MKLNPVLRDFWKTKKPIKCLYGGRMSGKSYDTAGILLYLASTYKLRILCTRRFQAKISESVYALLKKLIQEDEYFMGLFTVLETTIRCKTTGSEFIFLGIERNLSDIKGLSNIDITWVEEAEKLTEEQWNTLRPTILREQSSFCILVWNPHLATDFVYSNFILGSREDTLVRKINYIDNPFLTDSAKDLIRVDKENLEPEEFEHIYLGVPKKDDEHAIISRSWVEAAVNAHEILGITMTGGRTVGYDVADSGADSNAAIAFDGAVCVEIDEWKAPEDELKESALRAWSMVGNGRLVYDSIGVGAGVGSNLKGIRAANGKYFKFNAGDSVSYPDREYAPKITNKEKFENLKAQAWRDVADRFRNTYNAVNKGMKYDPGDLISISADLPHIERLKTELCLPRKSVSKRGLDMVETKDSLKKRGFASPNLADAFIMSACPHLVKKAGGLSADQF
jgi:phage terminase large subunit